MAFRLYILKRLDYLCNAMSIMTKYVFKKGVKIPGTRLTPVGITTMVKGDKAGRTAYVFNCDCGNIYVQLPHVVGEGYVKSCGCLLRDKFVERSTTHGLSKRPEYTASFSAFSRCNNPKNANYNNYGARGIKCEFRDYVEMTKWLVENLPKPSGKFLLDRKNNDGNYAPGNLRWATPKESCRNERFLHHVTIGGETKTLSEWSSQSGVGHMTISWRIKAGFPQDLWLHKGKITGRMLLERQFNAI